MPPFAHVSSVKLQLRHARHSYDAKPYFGKRAFVHLSNYSPAFGWSRLFGRRRGACRLLKSPYRLPPTEVPLAAGLYFVLESSGSRSMFVVLWNLLSAPSVVYDEPSKMGHLRNRDALSSRGGSLPQGCRVKCIVNSSFLFFLFRNILRNLEVPSRIS